MRTLSARLPCSAGGALAHWKGAAECPQNNTHPNKCHTTNMVGSAVGAFRPPWALGDALMTMATGGVDEPDFGHVMALADAACAKSVAGVPWATLTVQQAQGRGLPCMYVQETGPFRFGPGPKIWSEKALVVFFRLGNFLGLIRMSVVDKGFPCLIPRSVLQQLGSAIGSPRDR